MKPTIYLLILCFLMSSILTTKTYAQELDVISDDELFDMDLEALMNIEVKTGSKIEQSLAESPASIMVITDQMIKERGYHYLEEILHDLPGFDFNKNYGVNYSTIFMRGYRSANSDRFILLFDGINENDIWKQTTWISRQYPVSQVKQIEILYGPASALYGTNAFSGIVNVITKKGDEVGDVSLVTSAGSWGRKNIEFSSGKNLSENISYNITAKYFSQDDLHQYDEWSCIDGPEDFTQTYLDRVGGPEMLYLIDGRLKKEELDQPLGSQNYAIHGNLRLGNLTFTALNWTKKELEGYFYNPFKRYGKWTQWYENNQGYSFSHDKKINEKMSLSSSLGFRSHRVLESLEGGQKYLTAPLTDETDPDYLHSQTIDPTDPSSFQLLPREVITDAGDTAYVANIIYHYTLSTWDMALDEQFTYNISDKLNFILGGKYTYTNTQEDYEVGTHNYNIVATPRHIKKNMAGYTQLIYKPIKSLFLTAGLRYEDQKDEDNVGYSVLVPRFSAVYKANENLVFRFQYGEAFQEADDWHKFATDFDLRPYNSSELEPEKLRSFELGTTAKLFDKALVSATGYYTVVSNFIGEVDNTATNPYHGYTYGIHFENISGNDVIIYGYEANFNAKIIKGLSVNGNISGAWNFAQNAKMDEDANGVYQTTDANGNLLYDEDNDGLADSALVLIGDIAPVKINFGLLYNYKNKLTVYPKVNFVATKKTVNWRGDNTSSPIEREIDGYAIVGLNVRAINMFGFVKGMDVNVKIDNVFNSEYYNPGSRSADGVKYTAKVLQPGFNVMAGISYAF